MSLEITEDLIARQPPEAQAIIRILLGKIAELEARLNKTPENSSRPPSTQHPHAKLAQSKRSNAKRKRGGQKGYPKYERSLIPTDNCQAVVPLKPDACRRCGSKLSGDDRQPLRHQVWELPEIQPVVTEYQQHRLRCECCGTATCADLPDGVPSGQSGPKLIAFVALLMACFRQGKRRTAEFVRMVFNIPCSASLTVKHQTIATAALRPAYDELAAALPEQTHLNGDETPTKEGPTKSWLWTFVAKSFTLFALRPTRAATVLDELLGDEFRGVMGCDRAKMYWQCGRLQWCWAHLKRDFQALIDDPDHQAKRLGRDLMRPTKELFRQWSRCRDGTITRRGLKRILAPLREEVRSLLLRGRFSGNPRPGRDVPRVIRPSRLVVDLPGCRRRRADEQRGGALVASRGDLAEIVIRHAKRRRQPIRRNAAERHRNLPPAKLQRVPLHHASRHGPIPTPHVPINARWGVNGYSFRSSSSMNP